MGLLERLGERHASERLGGRLARERLGWVGLLARGWTWGGRGVDTKLKVGGA